MTEGATSEILPASTHLATFEESDRATLSSYGKFVEFKANNIIVKEGDPQESLYFLLEGVMHAVHQVNSGMVPLGTIKKGEWFGEINIFDPQTATAMCVAHMDSKVWMISRDMLEQFLNDHPSLGCILLLGVAEGLARRTRGMVKKLNATWELSY